MVWWRFLFASLFLCHCCACIVSVVSFRCRYVFPSAAGQQEDISVPRRSLSVQLCFDHWPHDAALALTVSLPVELGRYSSVVATDISRLLPPLRSPALHCHTPTLVTHILVTPRTHAGSKRRIQACLSPQPRGTSPAHGGVPLIPRVG